MSETEHYDEIQAERQQQMEMKRGQWGGQKPDTRTRNEAREAHLVPGPRGWKEPFGKEEESKLHKKKKNKKKKKNNTMEGQRRTE